MFVCEAVIQQQLPYICLSVVVAQQRALFTQSLLGSGSTCYSTFSTSEEIEAFKVKV
jgi:4-diphosphocytidyl-2C-methyl-D-erythritol kinase